MNDHFWPNAKCCWVGCDEPATILFRLDKQKPKATKAPIKPFNAYTDTLLCPGHHETWKALP